MPENTERAAVEAMARAIREAPMRATIMSAAVIDTTLPMSEAVLLRGQAALTALVALHPGIGAVLRGEAVITMLPTDILPGFAVGQTWVPTSGRAQPRTIMWIGKGPRHWVDVPCIGWAHDPVNPSWVEGDYRHDGYLRVPEWRGWIKNRKAQLAASTYAPTAGGAA